MIITLSRKDMPLEAKSAQNNYCHTRIRQKPVNLHWGNIPMQILQQKLAVLNYYPNGRYYPNGQSFIQMDAIIQMDVIIIQMDVAKKLHIILNLYLTQI